MSKVGCREASWGQEARGCLRFAHLRRAGSGSGLGAGGKDKGKHGGRKADGRVFLPSLENTLGWGWKERILEREGSWAQ